MKTVGFATRWLLITFSKAIQKEKARQNGLKGGWEMSMSKYHVTIILEELAIRESSFYHKCT